MENASRASCRYVVVTLFPKMFDGFIKQGVIGGSFSSGIASIKFVNPREFADDRHKTVDDEPYGGGAGMVMKAGPLCEAIDKAKKIEPGAPVCNLSPQGADFNDATAKKIAAMESLILVCGRYTGIDQRVIDSRVDLELSIGDYVVSGGEIPAMIVIDSALRHVPGVLGSDKSASLDSHFDGMLAPPCYTRPADFEGMKVPPVLLSGNHAEIERWRKEESRSRTEKKRKGGKKAPF